MKASTGYGNHSDAALLGRAIAEDAMQRGNIRAPGLVLAFCSGRLDATAFYQGLRTAVGDGVPIIGGSALGIITNDQLCSDGAPAGVAILDPLWEHSSAGR